MLVLNREDCGLKIVSGFADLLDFELLKARDQRRLAAGTSGSESQDDPFAGGAIFSFKDPTYSAENGGFHPVEVCINALGKLQYVTDFAYVGALPFVELAKELDFNFSQGCFGHMGIDYPLTEGAELFAIFQANFVSYYQSEIFTVEVTD